MEISLDTLEKNHLIGRLKLIELLERLSPYRDMKERVERRFSQALSLLPEAKREASLAVFGSTLYITKQMLEDTWKYLWTAFCNRIGEVPSFEDLLVLELDRDALRDDFYRANALVGRLQDNLPLRSTHDIIDGLMQLEVGGLNPDLQILLPKVLSKPYWVLLVDISMSGTSAVSELRRLHLIGSILAPNEDKTIVLLVQVLTGQAEADLQKNRSDYISAIHVPISCALNTPHYSLFDDPTLVGQMRELCRWFAETHVLSSHYRLAELSKQQNDPDIAAFGFGARGWNIVTYKNTPNNTLPLLWFRPPTDAYRPPFERLDSRIRSPWPGRRDWMERLEGDDGLRCRLRDQLGGLAKL